MGIYASVWTGSGTDTDPVRPLVVDNPATETWTGIAMKDFVFLNYTQALAPQQQPVKTGIVLMAPNLDTPIGQAVVDVLTKPPFKFPCTATETGRDIAHRIGVWFEGDR